MEELLTLPKFAKLAGCSTRTLFKRIEEKLIEPYEIRNGRNYFVASQLSILRRVESSVSQRKSYGYYRVSSNSQKSQLDDQLKLIEVFAASKGIILEKSFKDLASGMNFNRPNFNTLLSEVVANKVDKIICTYEDRLMRFGFPLFKKICEAHGTEIIVINSSTTSPEAEMVEDLMTIIHVFSARLYGLRSSKGRINDILRKAQDTEVK